MGKLYANQRINLNAKGQLCTDEDSTSASLFATPGQEFDEALLPVERYPNRDEYFDDGSEEKTAARPKKRVASAGSVKVVAEADASPAPAPEVAEVEPKKKHR